MSQKVRVLIRLKEGVLDPQGKTVQGALQSLGFEGVENVRVGKIIELDMAEAGGGLEPQVEAMCAKLLVNPVIEDYEILGG